jgi:hypothetical protein
MLSAAKHLLYFVESKQKQILRSAQNDVLTPFFQEPTEAAESTCSLTQGALQRQPKASGS